MMGIQMLPCHTPLRSAWHGNGQAKEKMNHIIKSIKELTKCNDIDLQKIQTALDRRRLKKNDFLLKSGQVCRQYYFVESGT
ncbi:MAG: hypothetical protein AAF705_10925, partial [Bacteroidota bacterium]